MSAIWEFFLQGVGEALLEGAFRASGQSFRQRTRAHPVVAGVGVILMGSVTGSIPSLCGRRASFSQGRYTA